ncbi:hypothetical protein BVRB_020210 [Beta vulgaris subsp. vulgaris]|uniref:Mitochondrial import inner membrane translocase subunit TIM50 n=1 Tax=Beta vulgaris subsp. vulgaris TaxID=3555 RepID=A0A0J8B3Z1_BETVV|nr:hypothetical protein BVRB_020210 [Beta vulgaris subsp. vulgaris]
MFQAGYEICAFTSGHQAVVDPVLTQLDRHRVITHRLYRDATTYRNGVHMKDLSKLNRDLSKVIIVDDESEAFSMHTNNGITVKKFDGDPQDVTLLQLIPVLESMIADDVADVREVLRQYPGADGIQKFTEERIARNKALRDQHILAGKKSDSGRGNAIKTLASWFGISSNARQ